MKIKYSHASSTIKVIPSLLDPKIIPARYGEMYTPMAKMDRKNKIKPNHQLVQPLRRKPKYPNLRKKNKTMTIEHVYQGNKSE